jgi:hypothetical protein
MSDNEERRMLTEASSILGSRVDSAKRLSDLVSSHSDYIQKRLKSDPNGPIICGFMRVFVCLPNRVAMYKYNRSIFQLILRLLKLAMESGSGRDMEAEISRSMGRSRPKRKRQARG